MYFTIDNKDGGICGTSIDGDMSNFPAGLRDEYHFVKVEDFLADCRTDDEKIKKVFKSARLFHEYYPIKNGIVVEIEWGDWKHDHRFCDNLMGVLKYSLENETVTEEDGSDCYSAIRTYKKVA